MEMSEYVLEIKHIPNKRNLVTDGLAHQLAESFLTKYHGEDYEPELDATFRLLSCGEQLQNDNILAKSLNYVIVNQCFYQGLKDSVVLVPKIQQRKFILR